MVAADVAELHEDGASRGDSPTPIFYRARMLEKTMGGLAQDREVRTPGSGFKFRPPEDCFKPTVSAQPADECSSLFWA